MSTNTYFSNYSHPGQQGLINDLIIESIKMYGLDVQYIPRTLGAVDKILNEDDLSTFDGSYPLEMYIVDVDGFQGEGDFLSKFGLQIRDSMTLAVARDRFDTEVGTPESIPRPNEGDLIYFRLNGKIFEIMHTEHEPVFYQMGTLQFYTLRVELFEYSGERFSTGNTAIDDRYTQYDMTTNTAIANVDTVDTFADNDPFEREGDAIIDFTENNPYGEDTY